MELFDSRLEVAKSLDSRPRQVDLELLSVEYSKFKADLHEQLNYIMSRISILENVSTRFNEKLDDLEQYSRRNCLLIHGLQESAKEDCLAVTKEFLTFNLGIQVNPCMLDRAHRIDKQRESKSRHMIVKFINYQDRARVWQAKKSLKSSGFVITESLTSYRMKLLNETRELLDKSKSVDLRWQDRCATR
ncbi:hypothetical protein J437_LFUL011208 [Ladona fulva]|uniref:Uncharacterized protein n=1 Tax=Ladona fulva TaxID=123851 RepID=A0A8K0KKX3_LADFU|nr:hypothetical protein J437_LFUL011208 [Ladona fulva]